MSSPLILVECACSTELARKGLCARGQLNELMSDSVSFPAGLVSLGIVVTSSFYVQGPYIVEEDTVGGTA